MAKNQVLAVGRVEALCINGNSVKKIKFLPTGPKGDVHAGFLRQINGHDTAYLSTSSLKKKHHKVLNTRTWTALSSEEVKEIEQQLNLPVPAGCMMENLIISGVPHFSQLPPTSRFVFPFRYENQAILAVWEENGPCSGIGEPFERRYGIEGLKTKFIAAAIHRRGVMGLVYAPGHVEVGDEVRVYPPAQ